jgi:ABC-type cobalamin/Fe3+-siderophores transport system ATPase subunit
MLDLQNLHFTYPATPGQPLFTGLSAHLPAGVTLVCGGDGCGKSTLLRLLAGDLAPASGQVVMTEADRAQVFWMDPRSEAVNATLNNVVVQTYFDALAPHWPDLDTAWLAELNENLGLVPHLHKPMFMLSTGSRRKVLLAAGLASGAPVTLLDEPFAALDTPSIRCVTAALVRAAAQPQRLCVIADYQAPPGVPLSSVITLS